MRGRSRDVQEKIHWFLVGACCALTGFSVQHDRKIQKVSFCGKIFSLPLKLALSVQARLEGGEVIWRTRYVFPD